MESGKKTLNHSRQDIVDHPVLMVKSVTDKTGVTKFKKLVYIMTLKEALWLPCSSGYFQNKKGIMYNRNVVKNEEIHTVFLVTFEDNE